MNPAPESGPQLEHGYTRLAHGLLEALLQYPFTAAELKLVFAVIRSTYGWGRKDAVLSILELAHLANVSDRHAKRLLQQLARDQVLIKRRLSRVRVAMGVNKHFSTWRLRLKRPGTAVPKKVSEVSP